MTYAVSNPPFLAVPALAGGASGSNKGGNIWVYRSTDSIPAVVAPYYFSNGALEGMQVSDVVVVIDTATPAIAICSVVNASLSLGVSVQLSQEASGLFGPLYVTNTRASNGTAGNITLTDADAGCLIVQASTDTSSRTVTIAKGLNAGARAFHLYSEPSAGGLVVTPAAGVTLQRADGTGAVANATLAAGSDATIMHVRAEIYKITGSSLS
jgi:hypothetical protein